MKTEPLKPLRPKVLILNCHEGWNRLFAMSLEDEFEAVCTVRGADALEMVEQTSFSVVLVELLMPTMTGLKFVEELHRRNVWTPVILTTAAVRKGEEDRLRLPPGVFACLAHPIGLERLISTIKAAIADQTQKTPETEARPEES